MKKSGFTLFEMLLYIALATMLIGGAISSVESLSFISQSMKKVAVTKDESIFQLEDQELSNLEL